jgi:hypothetical protein
LTVSDPSQQTSLTAAEAQEQESTPPSAEPDLDSDLEQETVEQELQGYPDQPTTS